MATSHVDKIMEEGREQGREEGRSEGRAEGMLQGKQDALLRLLKKKFGELPEELTSRVQAMTSAEALDALLDQVLVSSSLDEMDVPG